MIGRKADKTGTGSERIGKRAGRRSVCAAAGLLLLACTSCSTSYQPKVTQDNISNYFSTEILDNIGGSSSYQIVAVDHTTSAFSQAILAGLGQPLADGVGPFTTTSNGFLDIALPADVTIGTQGVWALEVPGVMGLFSNGGAYPMVSTTSCPSISQTQTFQFLSLSPLSTDTTIGTVAYGSVDVVTSGDLVNFTNIKQFVFPAASSPAGTAVTVNPGPSAISGNCGNTAYGQVVSITQFINEGGQGMLQTVDTLNMNSNFLLEAGSNEPTLPNILGGAGAIGLAKPASAVNTTSLVGGSFNGFFNLAGNPAAFTGSSSACSSLLASFASLPTQPSASSLYGGDFPNQDPSMNATANCDVAIDLGTEDTNNNGLYPAATIYLGADYPGNVNGAPAVLPALAIAGQIGSQNAIFVESNTSLDPNTNNPFQIFLLQASH